jgi:hypothetical protein
MYECGEEGESRTAADAPKGAPLKLSVIVLQNENLSGVSSEAVLTT